MINKLKRTNRGVILAGIALISLIIFVAADDAAFKKDSPVMHKQIDDYFARLAEISVNQQDMDVLRQKYTDLIDEIMIHPPELNMEPWYWRPDKSHVIGQAEMFNQSKGYVSNFTYRLQDVNITKEGPGLAFIDVRYSMTVETKGGVTIVPVPGGVRTFSYLGSYYGGKHWGPDWGYYDNVINSPTYPVEEDDEDYDLELRYTMTGRLSIEAKKQGGQWMFYSLNDWGDFGGQPTILSGIPPASRTEPALTETPREPQDNIPPQDNNNPEVTA
jgi:hypothetical protein